MMRRLARLGLTGLALALTGGLHATVTDGPAAARVTPVPGRGELLYTTHCIACHTEQVHWRDRKAASDWRRLKAEVRRWQAAARLRWSEADIVAVARYLNETIYHLPQNDDVLGGLPPADSPDRLARGRR